MSSFASMTPFERIRAMHRRVKHQFASMIAVAICIAASASPAFAGGKGTAGGKPKAGGSSSLYLKDITTGVDHATSANYGDTITFDVSTTQTQYPTVNVKCYQNGTLVFGASAGFYPTYPWPWAQVMTLSSSAWTGGAASCTAVLSGSTTLATLNFPVNG
jgi:hypothetical protein